MEQGRIKAAAVQINGIRPLAVDRGTSHQVVVKVPQRRARRAANSRPAISFHVCVDQVEASLRKAETRSPNPAGVRIAKHVQLAGASQWPRQQSPVYEVARMVNLNSRKPFKRGGSNVVI